ncbi:unnamed protein product [Sphagnum jensenii]|uniref:Cytochrome P450 mono-oxygenase n=1 Tax=Sphagnum jensenii TaxID=128206 RepID=A0ABP1AAK8_9BRYO
MDVQGNKLGSSLSVGRFSVADLNTLEWWSVERLLVVGLAGIVTMFMFSQLFGGRKRNLPLGPRGLPIIGNIHQLRNDTIHITFMRMAEKYGPIIYLKLGSRGVVVASTAETGHEFVKV